MLLRTACGVRVNSAALRIRGQSCTVRTMVVSASIADCSTLLISARRSQSCYSNPRSRASALSSRSLALPAVQPLTMHRDRACLDINVRLTTRRRRHAYIVTNARCYAATARTCRPDQDALLLFRLCRHLCLLA